MSKVKITTWVDERTAGILRAQAAQHEVSISETCARTLQAAVKDEAAEGVGAELLLPSVRAAVRREVGRMSDRLSNLIVRAALESAADRRAMYQILVEDFGQERAAEINRRAWAQSVESLKKPAEGLREILGERIEDSDAGNDEEGEDGSSNGEASGEARVEGRAARVSGASGETPETPEGLEGGESP